MSSVSDPYGRLGCNAGGHAGCRFCGFGDYMQIPCPGDEPPPAPPAFSSVVLTAVIEMDFVDFDQDRYKRGLAARLGAELKDIQLDVTVGSLVVDATVMSSSAESSAQLAAAMELITPEELSASTGAAVASLTPRPVSVLLSPAPPPISTEFVVGASGLSTNGGSSDADDWTIMIIAAGALVGIIGISLAVGCCLMRQFFRRLERRDEKVARFSQWDHEQRCSSTSLTYQDRLSTSGIELGASSTAPSLPPPLAEPPQTLPPPPLSDRRRSLSPPLSEQPRSERRRSLSPPTESRLPTFDGDVYELGVGAVGITLGESPHGVVIRSVVVGAQAAKAAVPVGGVITAINGEPARSESKGTLNWQLATAPRPLTLHIKAAEINTVVPVELPAPAASTTAAHEVKFDNLPPEFEPPVNITSRSMPGKGVSGGVPRLGGENDDGFEARFTTATAEDSTHVYSSRGEQVSALAALLSARAPPSARVPPSARASAKQQGALGKGVQQLEAPNAPALSKRAMPSHTSTGHLRTGTGVDADIMDGFDTNFGFSSTEDASPSTAIWPELAASDAPPETTRADVFQEERAPSPTKPAGVVGLLSMRKAADESGAVSEAMSAMNEQKKKLATLRAEERVVQREEALQRRDSVRVADRQQLEQPQLELEAAAAAEAAVEATAAEEAKRAKERAEQERREQLEHERLAALEKAKAEAESAAAELLQKRDERLAQKTSPQPPAIPESPEPVFPPVAVASSATAESSMAQSPRTEAPLHAQTKIMNPPLPAAAPIATTPVPAFEHVEQTYVTRITLKMRADADMKSAPAGEMPANTHVHVREWRALPDGTRRANVCQVGSSPEKSGWLSCVAKDGAETLVPTKADEELMA